jgi:hypothetical protein
MAGKLAPLRGTHLGEACAGRDARAAASFLRREGQIAGAVCFAPQPFQFARDSFLNRRWHGRKQTRRTRTFVPLDLSAKFFDRFVIDDQK